MLEYIRSLLKKENIGLCEAARLSSCRVINPRLLEKNNIPPDGNGTVFVLAVPYMTHYESTPIISAYAIAEDYHRFFAALFDNILPKLRKKYPAQKFAGFTDHSPIDERAAAIAAGVGIIGRNGMLITKQYSSYVFIGEIITDSHTDIKPKEPQYCEGCGLCIAACPYNMKKCLSAVTQKKGELTDEEKALMIKHNTAWGCDICQQVCPYTAAAIASGSIYTNIEYFKKSLTPRPAAEMIENMSDDDFSRRAYSWRGRDTIIRNLKIIENAKNADCTAGGCLSEHKKR